MVIHTGMKTVNHFSKKGRKRIFLSHWSNLDCSIFYLHWIKGTTFNLHAHQWQQVNKNSYGALEFLYFKKGQETFVLWMDRSLLRCFFTHKVWLVSFWNDTFLFGDIEPSTSFQGASAPYVVYYGT